MNNDRRKRLSKIIDMLNGAVSEIESVLDDENDCMCNYPENLQSTDAYLGMEEAVDTLSEAQSSLQEIINELEGLV